MWLFGKNVVVLRYRTSRLKVAFVLVNLRSSNFKRTFSVRCNGSNLMDKKINEHLFEWLLAGWAGHKECPQVCFKSLNKCNLSDLNTELNTLLNEPTVTTLRKTTVTSIAV